MVTANDLLTALRRATSYEPAIAVLDLSGNDFAGGSNAGLRILEYLKTNLPKCRILGMISEVLPATRQQCFKLGVDELLDKPFDTEQLLGLLRRLAPFRSLDSIESGAFKLCY